MAVPKKKKSLSSSKKKYISNNKKDFKVRKRNYIFLDFMKVLIKKENWMPNNFITDNKK